MSHAYRRSFENLFPSMFSQIGSLRATWYSLDYANPYIGAYELTRAFGNLRGNELGFAGSRVGRIFFETLADAGVRLRHLKIGQHWQPTRAMDKIANHKLDPPYSFCNLRMPPGPHRTCDTRALCCESDIVKYPLRSLPDRTSQHTIFDDLRTIEITDFRHDDTHSADCLIKNLIKRSEKLQNLVLGQTGPPRPRNLSHPDLGIHALDINLILKPLRFRNLKQVYINSGTASLDNLEKLFAATRATIVDVRLDAGMLDGYGNGWAALSEEFRDWNFPYLQAYVLLYFDYNKGPPRRVSETIHLEDFILKHTDENPLDAREKRLEAAMQMS